MAEVNIRPFENGDAAGVMNLIVEIQRNEYEIAITADDQPDLPQFYQTGAGNFWVAVVDGEVVGTLGLRDIGGGDVALRVVALPSACQPATAIRPSRKSTRRKKSSSTSAAARIRSA